MADIAIFRINYKSDFIITLESDAGWATPFCIKFWTDSPQRAFYVQYDGETYTHCAPVAGEPTKLSVQFDDHHLGIGDLKYQIAYHFTVADFPNDTEDEVLNQAAVIINEDGQQEQVMLDLNGETAPEIAFSLPAYANEQQRIANEQQRIANEEQRITNEEQRITAEQQRITNENQRISNEEARVAEFARLKRESEAATEDANEAAVLATTATDLASAKAQLAQDAATLANQKAQLAADKAALAAAAADLATAKAQLAQEKATYAQTQGDYAKAQGDYAKAEGDAIKALNTQMTANEQTRQQNEQARQTAEQQRVTEFEQQMASQQTAYEQAEANRESTFETAEARRDAEVDEKVADIMNLQTRVTALEEVVADIETIAEGYVRVAGSSSPALSYKSYKYHEQGGFGRESVFSLFYPCLVGTPLTGSGTEGKVLHVLQKFGATTIDGTPKWLDIYGNTHAIDGSEGDVMIVNIEPYYRIMGQHEIEGTEYDVFLVSRSPFTWQGIEAEHVMKGGVSPDFCVSHQDTDGVTRMHSVYNPAWDGSYQAPDTVDGKYIYDYDAETGEITETYDENATLLGGAGGLPTTDLALPTGEQRAMNNNPDTTKTVPWMNQTAASVEDWYSVLLAEGGTFDAHNANKMGSGYSANDPASAGDWEQSASGAKNGLRLVDKDGNWRVYNLASNMRYILGKGGSFYGGQIINSYRNPFHVLEAQRAVSFAIQNDVHELEWFAFEGNLYKWRSVEGFAGPEQGEMTCVLWKKLAGKLGAAAKDPSDTSVSIAGNRIEFLISIALFHGITTQVSPSWWCSGLVFTQDENGVIEAYMEREQEALALTPTGDKPLSERWPFETAYKHVGSFTQSSQEYQKNYSNDAIMLPKSNALKSGAGLHTYVGTANSFNGNNPSSGKSVRGFRRGGSARNSYLSPLLLVATFSPSYAFASFGFGTCCRITEA